ncbi:hypothetical protein AXF42_Ash019298 [Apostasia shenzhenica]|uniref:FLZ-type domain-containing protein n=1 Tax=Apostasia shenzhenica TaxID=1088818 RepID=A0A2I0ARA3_9ASPA|nr:hypothetical protein AXF42_Ash019298 [Apostasia shenzhenica]
MMLGKRARASVRRTTSMTELPLDLSLVEEALNPSDPEIEAAIAVNQQQRQIQQREPMDPWGEDDWLGDWQRNNINNSNTAPSEPAVMISRRGSLRSSADFEVTVVETAPFLRACSLCKRRLAPGRDIFMYRGEIAFCSSECREQQINLDERKDKCSLYSMKKESAPQATASSEGSGGGETVAAA